MTIYKSEAEVRARLAVLADPVKIKEYLEHVYTFNDEVIEILGDGAYVLYVCVVCCVLCVCVLFMETTANNNRALCTSSYLGQAASGRLRRIVRS